MLPAPNVAVVHPHQSAIAKGMAIAIRQRTFGGSSDVRKDQRGSSLACQTLKVDTIPSRDRGSENARGRPERWWRVVTDTEAIAVMRTAGIEAKTGVVGLG